MVGDGISYIKVLTNAPTNLSRVLLSSPDSATILGNLEDGIDDVDAVNVRQLRKAISQVSGLTDLTQGNGIIIDKITDPTSPIISIDPDYINVYTAGNGLAYYLSNKEFSLNIEAYITPNKIELFSGDRITLSTVDAGVSNTGDILLETSATGKLEVKTLANYDSDRSANYTNRSLVDKEYVDNQIGDFLHLTGAINESADGDKTFTGTTQINYHVGDRLYSTNSVAPVIGFYNDITNGKTAFTITGNVGSADTNYLNVTAVPGGSNAILSSSGISTNIGIDLTPKGTGSVKITNLTGAGTRVTTLSSTGQIGAISNTTDGFVLTLASGVPTWVAPSGGGSGITTLNTLTGSTQTFAVGTTGTDFGIVSSGTAHTFNIPSASAANRGLVTTTVQTFAGDKTFSDNILLLNNKTVGSSTLTTNNLTFRDVTGGTNGILMKSTTQRVTVESGTNGNTQLVLVGGTGNISQFFGEAIEVSAQTSTLTLQSNTSKIQINSSTGTFVEAGKPFILQNGGSTPFSVGTQLSSGKLGLGAHFYNGGTPVIRNFDLWNKVSIVTDLLSELNIDYNGTNIAKISQTGDIELVISGKGIIVKDSGDASRRRITTVNGVLVVSAAL